MTIRVKDDVEVIYYIYIYIYIYIYSPPDFDTYLANVSKIHTTVNAFVYI